MNLSGTRLVERGMFLLATMALALQAQEKQDLVLPALRTLARHQREDGSWGEAPAACTCRRETPAGGRDAARIPLLIAALGSDDPAVRDQAQDALRSIGEAALPAIREALQGSDAEVRARCAGLASQLGGCFNPAPSGTGDVELTGLALLAFLGAGYTHRSRDWHDGISFGEVIRKGLKRLLARQNETGAFDAKDPVADIIASLALSQAYGMTRSVLLKEGAQRAAERAAAARVEETRGLAWKALAVKSAQLALLEVPHKERLEEIARALQDREDDAAVAATAIASIFAHKTRDAAWVAPLRSLEASSRDPETLYFGTLAMFQADGPRGPMWKGWWAPLKSRLGSAQRTEKDACERGSWDCGTFRGRLRATAFCAQMCETYYDYETLTRSKR